MERVFCCLQKAPLHEEQLKLWLCEVLLALHYIHGRHVLHRDIKSSNIFLTAEADVQIGGILPAARAACSLWAMLCLLLS